MSGAQTPTNGERPAAKSETGLFVAALAVVSVVLIVIALVAASGLILPSRTATVVVTVHSTGGIYDTDYTLHDNGEVVESGVLGPGRSDTTTLSIEWNGPFCEPHTLSATPAYGGYSGYYGYGPAQKSVNVCDGETYSVDLHL